MFMMRLMMIALTPNVITRSLKIGTAETLSLIAFAGFFNSSHLKKINNKKAMLQMKVNFDKKIKKRIGCLISS